MARLQHNSVMYSRRVKLLPNSCVAYIPGSIDRDLTMMPNDPLELTC